MPAETVTRVEFDIDWPPGQVACYVLDGEETVLFDGGGLPEWNDGQSFAERSGYELDEFDRVFLTHPHPDHTGQVRAVCEAGDPVVYAPHTARDRLRRPVEEVVARSRRALNEGGMDAENRERFLDEEREIREIMAQNLPIDAVDEWLVDDQRVVAGERTVDVVWTPGHQADHLCYLTEVNGERVAFSGDMGVEPFRAALLNDRLDREYHSSVGAYLRSLDRLAETDVDRVYPAHGPAHGDLDASLADDRESVERRLRGVRESLADGEKTAAEVTGEVSGGHDAIYLFPEVMSALAHLERAGDVIREPGEPARYRLS